ncbi:MAG TPA: ComEC/Rec2 family competence protein, partial [Planctomycetes bacterium]|nr:ComEC/Rec2 family competence protein [Planctomycetota bacterium]
MRGPPGVKALAHRPLVLLVLAVGAGLVADRLLGPARLLPAAAALGGALLLVRPAESRTWILGAGFFTGAFLPAAPAGGGPPGGPGFRPCLERPGAKDRSLRKGRQDPPRLFTARGRVETSPRVGLSGDLTFLVRGKGGVFRVHWREPAFSPARGDQVRFQGILRTGSFRKKTAALKTCLTRGTNLVLLEGAPWWSPPAFLDRARQALHRRLVSTLSRESRGLALCLVLGDPSRLLPWEEALFRRTGTAHLLVVSGLHVALVAWFAARLAGKGKSWIPFLAVAFYALLSGARPPALRAALGFGLWTLGRSKGRKGDLAGALAGAALPLLLLDPCRAFGPSFQVSYAAVAAMALMGPSLARSLRVLGLSQGLSLALAFSAAATLGAAPVSLFYFGAFSPWSFLLTPLLTPVLGLEVFLSAGALLAPRLAGPALAFLHGGVLFLL